MKLSHVDILLLKKMGVNNNQVKHTSSLFLKLESRSDYWVRPKYGHGHGSELPQPNQTKKPWKSTMDRLYYRVIGWFVSWCLGCPSHPIFFQGQKNNQIFDDIWLMRMMLEQDEENDENGIGWNRQEEAQLAGIGQKRLVLAEIGYAMLCYAGIGWNRLE